jgi:hypothetical protein
MSAKPCAGLYVPRFVIIGCSVVSILALKNIFDLSLMEGTGYFKSN